MLTGNDSVQRFDVFITYTHMRAADGSDDRGCATWLLTSMRERVKELYEFVPGGVLIL